MSFHATCEDRDLESEKLPGVLEKMFKKAILSDRKRIEEKLEKARKRYVFITP